MRVLVALLTLAIGLSSIHADAKTKKKKRHHKPKAAQTQKAASNAVQMDMEFEVNGSLIATPHIAAELNKMATITANSSDNTIYTIEVTPTKPKAGQVKMAFEISRMVHGRKEVIGAPRITTLSGEKARVEQKSEGGPTMSIEVTAKL